MTSHLIFLNHFQENINLISKKLGRIRMKILKALIFLSIIVSLVYSVPYGGGIANSVSLGISLRGGREISIGLVQASHEYAVPVASASVGLEGK